MARFAGGIDLTPPTLAAAGGGSNYSAAAGAVDVNNTYGTQREKSPRYDQLSARAMETAAEVEAQALKSEADVMSTGLTALGSAKQGQLVGQAKVEAAKEAAKASSGNQLLKTAGGVVGAGLKLLTGGMG